MQVQHTRLNSKTSLTHPLSWKRSWGVALGCSLLIMQGCASSSGEADRGKSTALGAVIGALSGAAISSSTGGKAGTGAVIGGVAGAVAGNLWSKHMEEKRQALERASQGTGIDVARTADNRIKLNVPSDFSFDKNSAAIKPGMKPVLDEMARNLAGTVSVDVVGHTDSSGTQEFNQALSIERADAVRTYLTNRGVTSSRVSIAGAGETQPVTSNETLAGQATNRRVEIFLREPAG
jgi:outer membrane protein OmpA-like peptidoglycan-associated protein